MPDFLGIGAQKAGTTWLHQMLGLHPRIRFPAGKEIHFWDRRGGRAAEEWLSLFPEAAPGTRQGEITPAYALLERAVIAEIRQHQPRLRVFYSVRNPIERAWSGALMALERAELEEDEVSDQWFVDHFRSRGSRRRTDYGGTLKRWASVFPVEQIRVVFFDDIVLRPRAVLGELTRHIGVGGRPFDQVPDDVLRQPMRQGAGIPIRPPLLAVLHDLYDDSIDAFSKQVGRDLQHWKSEPGAG